jgi:hypothetical protein
MNNARGDYARASDIPTTWLGLLLVLLAGANLMPTRSSATARLGSGALSPS